MALTGYKDFGGGVADVVQDDDGNALEGLTMTVFATPVGGTPISDILDKDGVATGGIVISQDDPNAGRFAFQAPEAYDVLYLNRGAGDRWRVISVQAMSSINAIGATINELSNRVDALETSGTIAEEIEAINETVATLSESVTDANNNAAAALDAVANAVGNTAVFWRWTGSRISNGDIGEIYDNNTDTAQMVKNGAIIRLDAAATGPTVVTLEKIDEFGNASEMYAAGSRPTVPAGQTFIKAEPPSSSVILPGQSCRPKLVTAPPTGTTSPSPVSVVASTTYNSEAGGSGSHAVPLPAGGSTGDTVVLVTATSGQSAITMTSPTPWGTVRNQQVTNTTTPRIMISTWIAPWSSSLSPAITVSPGGPCVAYCVILRNAPSSGTFGDIAGGGANAVGLTGFSIPGLTASSDADLTIAVAAAWYGNDVNGYHMTSAGGPPGLTEVADVVTSRTATTNFGLWVGIGTNVASGAVLPATAMTAAGGSGSSSGTATSWAGVLHTVKRVAASTGPTSVRLQVNFAGAE